MNILYTPAVDILLFATIAYLIAYYLYIRIFKKDLQAVASADIKVSFILLLIVSSVYYGSNTQAQIFGLSVHWFPYYLFISGLIEVVLFLAYRRIVGISWKEISKSTK